MTKERWERERDALRRLARVLAEEARGGLLEEALETLLETSRADAGVAFASNGTSLDLVAERGLSRPSDRRSGPLLADLRPAIAAAAMRAVSGRKSVYVVDLAAARSDVEGRDDFLACGFRAILARAVKHQRDAHGVLVLISRDPALLDAPRLAFVETVAHVVGLAAERNKRTERELGYRTAIVELGRMSAFGHLTVAAAHELKAPVASLGVHLTTQEDVINRLREVSNDWASPMVAELVELATDMRTELSQMMLLVGQLSAASKSEQASDRIDLSSLTQGTLALLRSELRRRGLSLTEDYAPGCLTIGRRDQLVQLILSLVFHAADACLRADSPRPAIAVRTGIDGSRVVLSIDDTGPPVPPEELSTIFQPFASSRADSRGAGFGLTISSDIVAALHGHIEVSNREQGGAAFRVVLPRASNVVADHDGQQMASTQPPADPSPDTRRVLIVDEDDVFVRSVRRALRPHDVRSAATASEAEIALLDPTYLPHLVLCDLALPGMTGDMLHARILAKRPEVAKRFVFITAGASSQREADYLRSSGRPTFLKPIEINGIWSLLNLPAPDPGAAKAESPTIPSGAPSGPRPRTGAPTGPPE